MHCKITMGLFMLLYLVTSSRVGAQGLKINGQTFLLNNTEFDMWGSRVASASQRDEYTNSSISYLDDYKAIGINCISLYLQGSNGGYSGPFFNDGLTINKAHLSRYKRIIKECEKRDMVVVAGIFYQRAIKYPDISSLKSEEDIRNAVRTFIRELKPYGYIIINIANEKYSFHSQSFGPFCFNEAENIISLCKEVKDENPQRIAGGGGYNDSLNVIIDSSKYAVVLLFDTFSGDIESERHSGWHYEYFMANGITNKPIVNVEFFGGWMHKFLPQGVYTQQGKEIHFAEIEQAKKYPGLYIHFHSNTWFQGVHMI